MARRAAQNNSTSTSFSRPAPTKEYPKRDLKFIGGLLFFFGIGFVGLLNVQPWIAVARQMGKQISFVPFLGSLINIPFLGGWIQWGVKESLSILGITFWGMTQYMELIPEFTKGKLKEWLVRIRYFVYVFEFVVCFMQFPAYKGGYAALAEDFPNLDVSAIDWWNLLVILPISAFAFEFIFLVLKKIKENLG
jgi:hypothetical protein